MLNYFLVMYTDYEKLGCAYFWDKQHFFQWIVKLTFSNMINYEFSLKSIANLISFSWITIESYKKCYENSFSTSNYVVYLKFSHIYSLLKKGSILPELFPNRLIGFLPVKFDLSITVKLCYSIFATSLKVTTASGSDNKFKRNLEL